jgi:hypothetical protein
MKRFLVFFLGCFLFIAYSYADVSSVFYGDNRYNLVVYEKAEFEKPVNFLKEQLQKKYSFLGEIKDCSEVIDVPAGTARGNHSFGAVCILENDKGNSSAMICADEMIGHVAMLVTNQKNVPYLVQFVIQNCVSG